MDTYNLIRQAILDKKSITCVYEGYIRHLTPHAIGTSKTRPFAMCYQYGGQSKTGLSSEPSKNWRCIEIDKISSLEINKDNPKTSSNHSMRNRCLDVIDLEVRY